MQNNKELEFLTILKNKFGEDILGVRNSKPRRMYIEIEPNSLRRVISFLKNDLGFDHLSTITGIDLGETIELIYHLVYMNSLVLSIKIKTPKNNLKIHTISDIYLPAELYEREIHDLLGVVFEDHPDLSRLILPEDWPRELYPLRKDKTIDQISSTLDKSEVGRE
ncbi:MAG: NADH-quinone oxidoreductase subunit C, partial [Aigarchaeota archaeon]|nr:NADH-quinone oxidoreductase subunit C [Aigarchaeota archaeon]MDW7987057.1 NADH-quinone oxidoreductase subunit C [Nitrososphaerota archaeon]